MILYLEMSDVTYLIHYKFRKSCGDGLPSVGASKFKMKGLIIIYRKFKLAQAVVRDEYVTFNVNDLIAYSVHYPVFFSACIRVYLKNNIRFDLDINYLDEIKSYFD